VERERPAEVGLCLDVKCLEALDCLGYFLLALNIEEEPPSEAFKSTKVLEKLRALSLFLFPLVEADVGLSFAVLIDLKLY